jgi:RNA polymerase sigma-70 factor (ECF subfamily)
VTRRSTGLDYCSCRDRSRAEDLTQDVFEKLLGKTRSGTLAVSGSSEAFLARVTRNTFLDGLRRNNTIIRGKEYHVVSLQDERDASGTASDNPEALSVRAETISVLRQAIASLRAEYRDIVVLEFYHGMSRREISERLGIPPTTVGSRQQAAHRDLRSFLMRTGDGQAYEY